MTPEPDASDLPLSSSSESDAGASGGASRHIASSALFRGLREIVIVHRGQEYRLRITRAEKLILTK